jgi:hypothetical protein
MFCLEIEENVAKKINNGDICILFFLLFILWRERSAIKIHIGYANELQHYGEKWHKIRRKIWRICSWRAGTVDTITVKLRKDVLHLSIYLKKYVFNLLFRCNHGLINYKDTKP